MSWLYKFHWERLFGVRFRLHPLFTFVMLLSAVLGHFLELLTLFGIVLIHELGHAAAAKHFGWRIREVALTPFGGVASTDEDGGVPAKEEAAVAAAGPAMNVLMSGFALAMHGAGIWTHAWTAFFVQANLTLLLFNLLPILPLDGGKLLRVSAGYLVPFYDAMKLSACWSMLAGAGMAGFALSPMAAGAAELNLLLIGAFLVYSNWRDWKALPYRFLRFLLSRSRRIREWLRRGMLPEPILVSERTRLSAVARKLKREKLHVIVVADDRGRVLGVLPEDFCTKHYLEKGQNRAVYELFM